MDKITVEIMGKAYTLISDENEETTKKIASYVNSKMEGLSKNFPSLPFDKLSILASLEITGELFKTKMDCEKRIERLVSMIENI